MSASTIGFVSSCLVHAVVQYSIIHLNKRGSYSKMLNCALAAVLVVALGGILFGVRYMRREAYLPYHAVVAGKSFAELDPGVQAVILGMLKVIGGGFATLGVTLLWLCFALHEGARWAPWAILTISAAALVPMLYVATTLRTFRPGAPTPVRPTLVMMILIVVGVGLSLLAR
ncbi:hypothetical protein [Bradyrhizobium sp. CCGUVB23]|uniref:hypothetical protein n=1 Tax=Bradyrhizobium sp. CCGUVB23 TaxID=2949630 RepID=UPI0020B36792|nr:hypothetical protein [Bradyrhizobium sp. CCGUVB23]MCP3466875.1 hypothetical protein [Bradyrhizobium sp. CCGUVB23]